MLLKIQESNDRVQHISYAMIYTTPSPPPPQKKKSTMFLKILKWNTLGGTILTKETKKCLKNNNCEDVSINMNVWIKCIHCPASTSINMSCTTTVPTMADTSPLLTLFNRGWRWWWWGCCWTSWTLDQKVWVAIYFFMRNLAWFLGKKSFYLAIFISHLKNFPQLTQQSEHMWSWNRVH